MSYFLYLLSFFLAQNFPMNGEIIETRNFKELNDYVYPETLVILDIDDTLLIPIQALGTDAWFMSRLKYYRNFIDDYTLALDKTLAEWEAIRHLTDVKIVEEGTEDIINELQKNHIKIMGLTTQGLALTTRTLMQLKTLHIDLSKTAPWHDDFYFINGSHGVLYKKGILFTSGTCKGEALIALFNHIDYYPTHVIFINDKKTHLQDVEKSMNLSKIHFIGLRYAYSDERVSQFSEELSEIQWNQSTFSHILSDEEAIFLKNSL